MTLVLELDDVLNEFYEARVSQNASQVPSPDLAFYIYTAVFLEITLFLLMCLFTSTVGHRRGQEERADIARS